MKSPPTLPGAALQALLLGGANVPLTPARRARMKKALLARAAAEPAPSTARAADAPPMRTLRAGEGHWRPLAPKVEMQILFDDGVTTSWLARVAPGGRLPAHEHAEGPEECLVLSGTCDLDGVFLSAGDYQLAPRGSRHVNVHSVAGCVLFIRSPSFKAARPAHRAVART
ncbi:MAG: cupin domain-containing protein [Betaproteobacteria bacterium]|nr:cupin domain-containing protein [Betaproteobacteria bacterium]